MIYCFLTSSFGEARKEDSPAERARGGKEFQRGGQRQEQPGKEGNGTTKQRLTPSPVRTLPSYPPWFPY